MRNFTYIDNSDHLKRIAKEWAKEKILAIDLECENNLHHYGVKISLIQITAKKFNYLLDALTIDDFSPFIEILENPEIEKVFHDVSYDLRMLQWQYKCKVRNVFDTHLAAQFIGLEALGLGSLLEQFFDVKKESKFQKADWTLRPIPNNMLKYAYKDSRYLLPLATILKNKLKKMKRLGWVEEECKQFEKNGLIWKNPTFWDLRRLTLLTPKERAIAKRLYDLREQLAKKVDRPVHFLISNKRLIEIVQKPMTKRDWETFRPAHPIVRARAEQFFNEMKKGSNETLMMPTTKKHTPNGQGKKFDEMNKLRNTIGAKFNIKSHLIVSKDQLSLILQDKNLNSLREWQKKALQKGGYYEKFLDLCE